MGGISDLTSSIVCPSEMVMLSKHLFIRQSKYLSFVFAPTYKSLCKSLRAQSK